MRDQRLLGQRQNDEHIHRHIGAEPRGTNTFGDAEPAINLHRPRVAALHLRQKGRRVFLLDQRGADAALAEIDGEGQPDRAAADDEYLRIAHTLCPDMRANSLP